MNETQYVMSKIKAGHKIHKHNGIWWEQTRSGYCKPAIPYQPINYGKIRPALRFSYIGFSHRVKELDHASSLWTPFVLRDDEIVNWSLGDLKKNKRRDIRKGLRENEVRLIDNIVPLRTEFSRILKSNAIRNGHGNPPGFYDLEKSTWWALLQKVSNYSEFWGAFKDDLMTAYICIHVIGERVVVDGVKSDTEHLSSCPIDAIWHEIISSLQERSCIREIWYGGKSNRQSLDKFKRNYGFKVVEIPYAIRLIAGMVKYPKFLKRKT